MLLTNQSIISQIKYQVPWFYRQEYPLFIKFLEYYYQWMETLDVDNAYGVLAIIDNYKKLKDIDTTLDSLIILFKSNYFRNFPEETKVQKRIFLKRIIDLYRTKGTKDSLDLLLYIIIGEKPEIYYPRDYLAKSSSISFETLYFIYCMPIDNSLDLFSLKNDIITIGTVDILVSNVFYISGYYQLIIDIDGKLKSLIENVNKIYHNGINIGSLIPVLSSLKILSSQHIIFKKNQTFNILNDDSITPALVSCESLKKGKIDSYIINNPGKNYKVGDKFISYEQGLDFEAIVTHVDTLGGVLEFSITNNNFMIDVIPKIISTSFLGRDESIQWYSSSHTTVEKIKIIDPGIKIDSTKSISFMNITGYMTLDVKTSFIGTVSNYSNTSNLLGGEKVLQDNYFYQNFSYVVAYGSSQPTFPEQEIKDLIHPAGYLLFIRKDIDDNLLISENSITDLYFNLEQDDHIIINIIMCEDLTYVRNKLGLIKYTDDTPLSAVNNYNYTNLDMDFCFEIDFNILQYNYLDSVSTDNIDTALEKLNNVINNI